MIDQHHSKIRKILVDRGLRLLEGPPTGIRGIDGIDDPARALVNDLDGHPHAFVLACIMDRQIKAELAWAIPERLRGRLGTFEFSDLRRLSEAQIQHAFVEPDALHRFPDKMAGLFHLGVQRIAREYEGDASRIWNPPVGSARLVVRFLEFKGIGPKIATMAANILVRSFRVPVTDRRYIDVSPDAHVRRVFQRVGFVRKGAGKDEVIYAARELHPEYPGVFDFPCWQIGQKWCRPQSPKCAECYLGSLCPTAAAGLM